MFEELDWQDALYPFWLSIPQSETERCLEEHLQELGGRVERNTELIDIEQFPDFARVTLKHRDESIETLDVPWVVGCDGARSRTRRLLGLEMKGRADDDVFILGDVRIDWDIPAGEGSNILSPDGILLIVPMPQPKLSHYRPYARSNRSRHAQDHPRLSAEPGKPTDQSRCAYPT